MADNKTAEQEKPKTSSTDPVAVKAGGDQKPKSQVDNKTSAQEILDPSTGAVEREETGNSLLIPQGGSSYPTAEALAFQKKSREEESKKAEEKLKKSESRSALQGASSGVLSPEAQKTVAESQKNQKK